MCWGKEKTGISVPNSTIPEQDQNPIIMQSDTSIIDNIFNASLMVFDRITSRDLDIYEMERLLDIREAEEQGKIARQKEMAGTPMPSKSFVVSGAVIGIAAVGLAAVLLLRK